MQVADIGAYTTSSEALLSVLTDGDLVTWGRRQEFQRMLYSVIHFKKKEWQLHLKINISVCGIFVIAVPHVLI